jgi:hypothetical protein
MVKNHPALIWRWLGRVQKSSNKRTKVTTSHRANCFLGRAGMSFVATIYPSWSAVRILPAEALRYE